MVGSVGPANLEGRPMPLIEWADSVKTGVPEIDQQHRQLFALVNDLYDKNVAGVAEPSVAETLTALTEYVDYHFTCEEELLAVCGYEDLQNHKAEHRKLMEQVVFYEKSHRQHPETFDMDDFLGFLQFWLRSHILQSDMAYVPSIARSGRPVES